MVVMSDSLLLNMRGREELVVDFFVGEISVLIKGMRHLGLNVKGVEHRLIKWLSLMDERILHLLGEASLIG
jgi:hypothetical protein